jgi:hypothetical protein
MSFQVKNGHTPHAHLARRLSDAAAHWRQTASSRPGSVCFAVCCGSLAINLFHPVLGYLLGGAWCAAQAILGWRPSCCRSTGVLALILVFIGSLIRPTNPLSVSVPFFELATCPSESRGRFRSYALRSISDDLPDTPCPVKPTAASELVLGLDTTDFLADTSYAPVLLLEGGSYARLTLSVEDAVGRRLFPPTLLELGPDEHFPWLPPKATADVTTDLARSIVADPTVHASAFAASTRRRLLKGGSFSSPHRGPSGGLFTPRVVQGHLPGQSAYGNAVHGRVPVSQAYQHPSLHQHPLHTQLAYRPMTDVATGIAIGHVLRGPRLSHGHPALEHAPRWASTRGQSFFYGRHALPRGAVVHTAAARFYMYPLLLSHRLACAP